MNESRIVIEERSLRELAEVLREKSGTTQPMDIDEMVAVADGIGLPEQEELNVTENGEYTPETYGFSKVTVDVQPEQEEISITENGEYTPSTYGFSKVEVDVQPTLEELYVDKNGEYTPTEYGYSKVTVDCPPPPPEEAFYLTGSLQYYCRNGRWDWFIAANGDKISTKDITYLNYSFGDSKLERIPFVFNVKDCTAFGDAFSGCINLRECPKIRGSIPMNTNLNCTNIINGCSNLRDVEELFEEDTFKNFNTIKVTSTYTSPKAPNTSGLNSLRKLPSWWYDLRLCEDSTAYPAASYSIYSNLGNSCYSIDRIENVPVWKCQGSMTSNAFGSAFQSAYRLEKFTFETDNGQPIVTQWKSQLLDLSYATGYVESFMKSTLLAKNNGITADKEVTDDASYQALKNDPDWFTTKPAYSRYNHDSAVETLNSLPDTSATGTNTIKFKKTCGSSTDGGAIENLTAEEIAVAAAKGWTVTLVN